MISSGSELSGAGLSGAGFSPETLSPAFWPEPEDPEELPPPQPLIDKTVSSAQITRAGCLISIVNYYLSGESLSGYTARVRRRVVR